MFAVISVHVSAVVHNCVFRSGLGVNNNTHGFIATLRRTAICLLIKGWIKSQNFPMPEGYQNTQKDTQKWGLGIGKDEECWAKRRKFSDFCWKMVGSHGWHGATRQLFLVMEHSGWVQWVVSTRNMVGKCAMTGTEKFLMHRFSLTLFLEVMCC